MLEVQSYGFQSIDATRPERPDSMAEMVAFSGAANRDRWLGRAFDGGCDRNSLRLALVLL